MTTKVVVQQFQAVCCPGSIEDPLRKKFALSDKSQVSSSPGTTIILDKQNRPLCKWPVIELDELGPFEKFLARELLDMKMRVVRCTILRSAVHVFVDDSRAWSKAFDHTLAKLNEAAKRGLIAH